MGFSLRVNHKKLAGASHPNRDDQFQRITALRRCAVENTPMISVDTKKKDSLRMPAPSGTASPNDHSERAAPSPTGSNPQANSTVFVGATADTPAFAVDCIEKWWRTDRKRYPQAETLQIRRQRRQQFHLQHRL